VTRLYRLKAVSFGLESYIKNFNKRWHVKTMDKAKPFQILAVRFQISRESAKYFLTRVQKSFKTEKPPHQLILKFMEDKNFEILPKPHHVATLMKEAGVWAYPLNPEPPGLIRSGEEDIYGE
jgi:hypothetical protein